MDEGPWKSWMTSRVRMGLFSHGKNMFKSDKNRGLQSRFKTISIIPNMIIGDHPKWGENKVSLKCS
jgi:hypothetical protein